MTSFSVTIQMDSSTLTALCANGFRLYAFQAVQGTSNGLPTVWFQTTEFAETTVVQWALEYQAFISSSPVFAGARITPSSLYPAAPGQTLEVTNPMGVGTVENRGPENAISIVNKTTTQLACGITLPPPDNGSAPLCAFPLFSNEVVVIVPTTQVLLMFANVPFEAGDVVEQTYDQAILISLADAPSRTVGYDIKQGWTWDDGGLWASTVAPDADLGPLLIQSNY